MLWGEVEEQIFFQKRPSLFRCSSLSKMKQNPVQMTASFESNLWRHIGKNKSTALRDVLVCFDICIGKCHSFYLQYGWLRSMALQGCSYYGYDANHTLNTTIFNSRNIKENTLEGWVKRDDSHV